jgi:hypothetical protein
MSLESQIEKLITAINSQTEAVNAFNGNIEKWLSSPIETATAEKQTEAPQTTEVEQSEEAPALTHKDVQDKVLAMVREDMGRKPKVKALLDEFGAKKVGDVDESRLVEFDSKLGEL